MGAGVYQIRNTQDGKIYVGSSQNLRRRLRVHRRLLERSKHFAKHLQAAWNLMGAGSFLFEVVELCEIAMLLEKEQRHITEKRAVDPKFGYNSNPAAANRRGSHLSAESKAKISKAHLGRKLSPEHLKALRTRMRENPPNLGRPMSEAQKAKLSELRKGTKASEKTRAKMSVQRRGIPKSEETRARMSAAAKLLPPRTAETKMRMSQSHLRFCALRKVTTDILGAR